jgi:hypothetical protein
MIERFASVGPSHREVGLVVSLNVSTMSERLEILRYMIKRLQILRYMDQTTLSV